ncbi:MAG: 50S ribosomal protein L11 methyltransferase, partial [Deltaproteobacteria bacterium]|nr:50S ribosomal protein L11 methyltransferase [Deltaproteobacteria bacterium]
LQPGMAFGTGQHPTTRLVAAAIAANAAPWRRLLDLGTGSGILAMIAAGCGVEDIDAVETDPETARVARENIVRNRMTERIRVTEDLRRCAGPYDAIVANILLEPLVALAPAIAERLAPNGMCYCSGILREQETVLVHAYANAGLRAPAIAREGEWSCVGFTRGT